MNKNYVPFMAYESAMARQERTIKRLWITTLVLFCAFVISILCLFYMVNQYETVEISQEVTQDDGIALLSGMGDVYYAN